MRRRYSGIAFLLLVSLVGCVQTPDVQTPDTQITTPQELWDLGTPSLVFVPDRYEEAVDRAFQSMSLRRRIAQRFVVFVPREFGVHRAGDADAEAAQRFAKEIWREQPAGFIVYPWNYRTRNDVILLTAKLRELREPGAPAFLVSADQEGGRVAAFRFRDMVQLPPAARVGDYEDIEFTEDLAYVSGRELVAMGVNMNLAPVLDLSAQADGSIIGDRSFGGNPHLVAEMGRAYLRGMERAGVITTAKHFPGHGVTRVDSHGRLPVVDHTIEDLRERDLRPFVAAVEEGVPAIMTAHILFPRIDGEWPVTISPTFLRGILRTDLAFHGVVISDGLAMGALADNYELDETLRRALRYGVDIILVHSEYDLIDLIDRVEGFISEGLLTPADIDRGTRRVLTLKARYGLL